MVPEEWPITAPIEDRGARPARAAGRQRLATVRKDFFLDPRDRLTEQERALMTAMLADLLGGIADEIRAGMPNGWGAANDDDGQRLVRDLGRAGLLDHPALMAMLLRRADEERIAVAVRARSPIRAAFLQALIADSNSTVAAAAMALILARGRRRDRLAQPRVEFDDLPSAIAGCLAQSTAAALRQTPPPGTTGDAADPELAAAAAELFERHDAAKGVAALTSALARALDDAGTLDDGLIEAAAEDGDLAFVAEALARRADIPGEAAWDHLLDADGSFALLLRMSGVTRKLAAMLLASLADLVGIADPGAEIARFDSLGGDDARSAAQWLRLNPDYRAALGVLGNVRHG